MIGNCLVCSLDRIDANVSGIVGVEPLLSVSQVRRLD
jgi:hypothetical protein